MPANHPGRRPGPVPGEPYYDGEGTRGRTEGRDRGRRLGPVRGEPYYYSEGAGPRTGGMNWETGELNIGLYERQMAGIAALISLANDVAAATRSSETISSPAGWERKQSRLSVISRLRQDEMTWNSLFLVMSTGLQSGTGFLFWIITAHLFSVSDVGKGSALISGVSLIGGLALIGLNMGMGRYLPNAHNRDALISSGLAMVAAIGALGALLYILLTPLIAPGLAFVEKSPVLTISFALITSATAFNTLTDFIFIASRKAKYTTLVDGVIGGLGKVALASILAGAGAYGLFLASAIGTVLAAVASLTPYSNSNARPHRSEAATRNSQAAAPVLRCELYWQRDQCTYCTHSSNHAARPPRGGVGSLFLCGTPDGPSSVYGGTRTGTDVSRRRFTARCRYASTQTAKPAPTCAILCADRRGYDRAGTLAAPCIRTAVLSLWLHKSYHSRSSGRPYIRELLVPDHSPASGQAPCHNCSQCNRSYCDMLVCLGWFFTWIDSRSMGMARRRSYSACVAGAAAREGRARHRRRPARSYGC